MTPLPAWARFVLRVAIPDLRREDTSGDLQELHDQRVQRWGRFIASWVTSMDASVVAAAFLIESWRDAWRAADVGFSWFDLKLGLRLIKKQPLLNLAALVALASGIGLANIGLTLVDAMVFSRLPYEGGERYLMIESYASENGRRVRTPDPARFHFLAERATALDYVGGKDHEQLNLFYGPDDMERVTGVVISPGAFRFLPVQPIAGRLLTDADGDRGAPPVVMIRESVWRLRFGRRMAAIGSALDVGGVERTIVGILPDHFEFPNSPRVWVPLDNQALGGTTEAIAPGVEIFGIRSQQSTWPSAQQEIEALSRQYEQETAGVSELRLRVVPYTHAGETGIWTAAAAFMAVLVLVLLVIASNVGHLVMVRSASRTSELAVRSALGAGRGRLVGQLFAEVAILVSLASVIAFLASNVALAWFRESMDEAPFWLRLSPSPRTLLGVAIVALLATVAAGLVPALAATQTRLERALRSSGRSFSGHGFGRFGSTMTVLEMAMSVALVGSSLIIARGALSYMHPNLDVPVDEVLTAHIRVEQPQSPTVSQGGTVSQGNTVSQGSTVSEDGTVEAGMAQGDLAKGDIVAWQRAAVVKTRNAMLAAVREVPGVVAVGATSSLPGDDSHPWPIQVEPAQGADGLDQGAVMPAPVVAVLPGYLEAVGAEPIMGRFVTEADLAADAPPVAVVNEPFIEEFFAGQNPIGRRIRVQPNDGEGAAPPEWREIVGVVADLGLSVANPELRAGYYVPMGSRRAVDVAIRVQGAPMAFAEAVRLAITRVDPRITLRRVQPLSEVTRKAAFNQSVFSGGLILLGSSALWLSLVGMFTITSLAVTQRTREIGIRTALGASSREILSLVSQRAMRHLALGSVLGAGVGMLLMQGVRAMGTGGPAGEPWELLGVALVLGWTGTMACWIPARRALHVSPAEALRAD